MKNLVLGIFVAILALPIASLMILAGYEKIRFVPALLAMLGWQVFVLSMIQLFDEAGWLPK